VLDKAEYSAFESTLNSPIVSYRIVNTKVFQIIEEETSCSDLETLELSQINKYYL